MKLNKEKVIKALETVIDPHIGIDVYSLGFIYEIDVKSDEEVFILMTLSTPMCPLDSEIKADIRQAIEKLGVKKVDIKLTFHPAWQPPAHMMRDPEEDIMF